MYVCMKLYKDMTMSSVVLHRSLNHSLFLCKMGMLTHLKSHSCREEDGEVLSRVPSML